MYKIFFFAILISNVNCNGIRSGKGFSVQSTGDPWPLPKTYEKFDDLLLVDAGNFRFHTVGAQCLILNDAYERYSRIIFGKQKIQRPLVFASERLSGASIDSLMVMTDNCCDGEYPSLSSDESYQLSVSMEGAVLKAKEVWGVLRGLETFSQLVFRSSPGQYVIYHSHVDDAPRFPHRGILLDSSRHFLKKEIILTNLEAMAQNKINVFHWHITDDQAFPFQSVKFPNMSQMGAYDAETHIYTPDDVQDVIEFARRRGIRVMVEFDSPGHSQSWGKAMPNLLTKCYSNGTFNGNYGPMNPAFNSTFSFLNEFFGEVAKVFPDEYLFLGGDEVSFYCWTTNPDISAFMKKMAFGTDYAKLEEYYIQRLLDIVTSLKKGYMVWQEVIDNGAKVASDTVVDVWKPGFQEELAKVTKLGYKTLLSACWYLDYISYGSDWKNYYKCDPQNFNGTQAQKDLIMGGEAALWGEFVDDTNVVSRLWPRASAVAERLWSPADTTSDVDKAQARIAEHRCRMVSRGFPAEELIGPGFCAKEF